MRTVPTYNWCAVAWCSLPLTSTSSTCTCPHTPHLPLVVFVRHTAQHSCSSWMSTPHNNFWFCITITFLLMWWIVHTYVCSYSTEYYTHIYYSTAPMWCLVLVRASWHVIWKKSITPLWVGYFITMVTIFTPGERSGIFCMLLEGCREGLFFCVVYHVYNALLKRVQCSVTYVQHTVQYSVTYVQYTVQYSGTCIQHTTIFCNLRTVHCTVFCNLCSVHCTVFCSLCTVYCTVFCNLLYVQYTVQCSQIIL